MKNFVQYDYLKNMVEDIKNYVMDIDNLENYTLEQLYDELWTADSVTGNGSGSYTFSRYQAELNLIGNWDLLADALKEFCCDINVLEKGAEYCDVSIRCYLLNDAITTVLSELNIDLKENY